MLKIKLQRKGKKHQASYRVVVGEQRSKLSGEQTDDLGWYDPHSRALEVDKERVAYWLKNGAQMTDTINNLLVGAGIVEGKKIPKHTYVKKEVSAEGEAKPVEGEGAQPEEKPAPEADKPAA